MEYAFNEIILVKFITRYYPLEPNQALIQKGKQIVTDIISGLIDGDEKFENLKMKDIDEIVNLVLGQFSYRFGGVSESIGAFGNFYFSNQYLKLSIIQHEEIKRIIDPLKDRLLKASFLLQQANQLPSIQDQQEEITRRKVQFLMNVLGIRGPEEEPKKKKPRNKNKKQTNLQKAKQTKQMLELKQKKDELNESIKTQIDEYETQATQQKHSICSKATQKRTIGTVVNYEDFLRCLEPPQDSMILQNNQNLTITQEKNELLIKYDEFFLATQQQNPLDLSQTISITIINNQEETVIGESIDLLRKGKDQKEIKGKKAVPQGKSKKYVKNANKSKIITRTKKGQIKNQKKQRKSRT